MAMDMVSGWSIAAMAVTLGITLVLPVGFAILALIKKWMAPLPLFVGMAVFFVMQMVLRATALQALGLWSGFRGLMEHSLVRALFYGGTAALAEVFGRYFCYKWFLKDHLDYRDGLAAGFGHGVVESILLVGLAMVNNLLISFAINGGSYAELTAAMEPGAAAQLLQTMVQTPPYAFLVGALERVFTVTFQIAMSLLVVAAIRHKKFWPVLLAFGLHTALDAGAVLLQGTSVWIVEAYCALFAAGSLWFLFWGKRLFSKPRGSQEEANQSLPSA